VCFDFIKSKKYGCIFWKFSCSYNENIAWNANGLTEKLFTEYSLTFRIKKVEQKAMKVTKVLFALYIRICEWDSLCEVNIKANHKLFPQIDCNRESEITHLSSET
jgi:hypothetical protein